MPLHLEIVTAERLVLSDDVDQVNAPTKDGRVGILPRNTFLNSRKFALANIRRWNNN
jgi:F0F1-type ATP synthase epsilon subunit